MLSTNNAGVKSLASHVVGGAAGALGRITGTLGEGVSALTMDDKFRAERRARINRKGGIAEGGKNLIRGVFGGISKFQLKSLSLK